jgi:flagellar basal body-associated protein FliL
MKDDGKNNLTETTEVEKPTKQVEKKVNKKNIITTVIIIIVLIVVVIAVYGLYNGSKVASYAKEVKTIMVDSNNKWSQSKIEESNRTTDEMYSSMQVIQKDASSQLKKLDTLNAPKNDESLESKSKEYFQIAIKASKNSLAILDYVKILESSQKDMQSLGGTSNNMAEFIAVFTKFHTAFSAILTKLRAATPPEAYKTFNSKYIAAIDRMDKAVVKAIGYAQSNQVDLLSNITSEFDSTSKELSQTTQPNQEQTMQDILSDSERMKLKNYPNEINNEADKLSKTIFSL